MLALAVQHVRSVHLNLRIVFLVGLGFSYRNVYLQFFGFTPDHIDFYTLTCLPVAGLLRSDVESMNCWSQTAIAKALGCSSVLQSEAFCTKTGDF